MSNIVIPLNGDIEDVVQNKKYKVGNLYKYNINNMVERNEENITCVYDEYDYKKNRYSSQNVHLYLDNYENNEEDIDRLELVIFELQKIVANYLKTVLEEDKYEIYAPIDKAKSGCVKYERKPYKYKNSKNKSVNLYRYVSVKINNNNVSVK